MNPGTQIPAQCPSSVWICGTGPAQVAGGQATDPGNCFPRTHGECLPAAAQLHQNTLATVCTQYGCTPPAAGGAQPQLSTAFTTCTQPVVCHPQTNTLLSQVPHCPTVAPMCPPPTNTLAGGGGAQAQAVPPTFCCHTTVGPAQAQGYAIPPTYCCGTTLGSNGPAQAQQIIVTQQAGCWTSVERCGTYQAAGGAAQNTCITVTHRPHTTCCGQTYVANNPAQGQAQGAVPPPTDNAGAGNGFHSLHCIWTLNVGHCPPPQGGQANDPAQAQGLAYTVGCPPPAQSNQQVLASAPPNCPTVHPAQCHTVYPPCGGANAGGEQAQGFPRHTMLGCPVQATQHVATCGTIAGYTHNPAMCPPPANAFAGGGQHPTYHPTWYCAYTTPAAGNQAQAQGSYNTQMCGTQPDQAQGIPYTHTPGCYTSTPHCIGDPAQAQGVANTQLFGCNTATATPTAHYTHHPPGCTTVTSAPEQAQGWTVVKACTTFAPAPAQAQAFQHTYHAGGGCGPADTTAGAQAQAQFPTLPPAVCLITKVANCGSPTGIWPFC